MGATGLAEQRWGGAGEGRGGLGPGGGPAFPSLPYPRKRPRFNMQRWRGGTHPHGRPYFKQRIYNKGPADAGICQNSAMGKIYLSRVEGPVTLGLRALKRTGGG